MNPAETVTAIDLVRKHKRIVVCSMGKPAFAAAKAVYTAHSFGLDWIELDATHAFHGDMGVLKSGDLVIIVSKSGETKETNDVALTLRDRFTLLALTSDQESRLAELCPNQLIVPVMEEASPHGYAPMASTTLYMMVLHALLCEAVDAQGVTREQYAENHTSGQIGRALAKEISE
jgi:arabinose-5-phosphate isomerase